MSTHAAALALGCAPSTAWRAVTRFKSEGESGLLDPRAENGSLKVDEDVRGGIWQILVGGPKDHGFERSTWSLEVLAKVIAKDLKVSLSRGHLSKVLHSLGISLKQARPSVRCPWNGRSTTRHLDDSAAQFRRATVLLV